MSDLRRKARLAVDRRRLQAADVGFIVSTGRTGTKFFETLFADHADVICRHEPQPDLFDVGMSKLRDPDASVAATTAAIVTHRRTPISEAEAAGKHYIESNPFLSLLITELAGLFPKARFLWVVRDPATYVGSAFSKSPDGSGTMRFYADDDHRLRLRATDVEGDPHAAEWDDFDRFERICWYWNACNRLIGEQLDALDPARSSSVRFEDLFAPDRSESEAALLRVADFFDAPLSEAQLARASDPVNTNPDVLLGAAGDWTARRRDRGNALSAPMRDELGYPAI